ncbi:MAG TPA: hypothetical protein VMB50_04450 [Myxococcales bacterium]|nr:hypothetical protein [Myxococcales bacterium]
MPFSSSILVGALVLAGCASGSTDDCGRVCSVRQGTGGAIDAEGGPLSATCPVGYTCDGSSSTCVANDGHCTSATSGGTTGGSSTGGGGGASSGTTGGTTG